VGGRGVGAGVVVEYVRLVLGRRRRQTNGCLGFVRAIFGVWVCCAEGVVDGEMEGSLTP
jgi:hypothetical protein